MKAFLLAAGLGTRLRPLTEKLPKPLLPIDGVPLICFPLARLRRAGIVDVGINLHYLGDKIPALLGDGKSLRMRLRYFREEKLLGTGGAIRNAREFLADAPFLLWNADTILDLDIAALLTAHNRHHGIATLAVSSRASLAEFGGLQFDKNGNLLGLQAAKDTAPNSQADAAVFCGASILAPRIFAYLENAGPTPCVLRQGVLPAIESGEKAEVFFSKGAFADLGTPRRYEQIDAAVKEDGEFRLLWQEARAFFKG